MSLKYRTSAGTSASNFTDLVVKVGDTLPIGSEIDYDGQSVPAGWQEVSETNLGDVVVDSIRSKNLFDKNRLWNAWINTQGDLVESASNRVSDYIDIRGMSHITISGSTTTPVIDAFYDSSKTFVSYVEVGAETATLQVPNNAYYIRVTVKPAALDTYQIEEGSTATPYKPHQELNNQEVYSTTETKVGTWIDGKPIYRKVVQGSLILSPQTWVDTGIVDSTIDLLINAKSFYAGSNTAVLEINANRTSDSKIQVLSTLSTTTYPTAILLEYTKTTN